MNYCIVKDNIIENIIVCEDDATAAEFGAVPSYEEARIGETYAPPPPEPTESEDVASLLVDHEYRLTLLELGITE